MRKIALSIFVVFISCIDAICCDCGRGRITVEAFNSYDWIFVGTLISEARSDKGDPRCRRTCVYKIIKSYKGTTVGDTVSVYDAEYSGACGLGFLTIGRDYLISAKGTVKKSTSDCSRTTQVPFQFWPRDSATINRLKGLHYFSRIYDTTHTNFHADTLFLNKHVLRIGKEGIQKFYDEDGDISAEGMYVNGAPEGLWNYFEEGKITTKGKYVNGKKDSLWGEPFIGKAVYINGYKAGEFTFQQTYLSDGKIGSKTEPVGDGKKWIKYNYHSNGQARYIAYCNPPKRDSNDKLRDAVFHGSFKMFNKKGVILQQGIDEDGFDVGHWKYYYENGEIRMEGDYIKGKKTGFWKIYYPNGRIKAEGAYEGDNAKIGVWKYFDEKGNDILPNPKLIEEDEDWFTYSGAKN